MRVNKTWCESAELRARYRDLMKEIAETGGDSFSSEHADTARDALTLLNEVEILIAERDEARADCIEFMHSQITGRSWSRRWKRAAKDWKAVAESIQDTADTWEVSGKTLLAENDRLKADRAALDKVAEAGERWLEADESRENGDMVNSYDSHETREVFRAALAVAPKKTD